MPKFKVDLVARLVGFLEMEIEADSKVQAELKAVGDAEKLPHYVWDVQYVDYTNITQGFRTVAVYEIDVNEIHQIEESSDEYAS